MPFGLTVTDYPRREEVFARTVAPNYQPGKALPDDVLQGGRGDIFGASHDGFFDTHFSQRVSDQDSSQ